MMDVSYNVIAHPDKPKSRINVGRGLTKDDGRVQWGTVGNCDLLIELDKPGFKKVSKRVEMRLKVSPQEPSPVFIEMVQER
jgi:hypothetical protein